MKYLNIIACLIIFASFTHNVNADEVPFETNKQKLMDAIVPVLELVEYEGTAFINTKELKPQDGLQYYTVLITYICSKNCTRRLMENDSMDLYEAIYTVDVPVSTASVTIQAEFTDIYGNEFYETVYTTSMTRDAGHQINWGNKWAVDLEKCRTGPVYAPRFARMSWQ